ANKRQFVAREVALSEVADCVLRIPGQAGNQLVLLIFVLIVGQLSDLAGNVGQLIAGKMSVTHECPWSDSLATTPALHFSERCPIEAVVLPNVRNLIGRIVNRMLAGDVTKKPVIARNRNG